MPLRDSPLRDFSPSKSLFNILRFPQRRSDLPFGHYKAMPPQNLKLFFSMVSVDNFFGHIYSLRFPASAFLDAKTSKPKLW